MTIDISLRLAIRRAINNAPGPEPGAQRVRVVWDDENPDWNFKCRTQHPDFIGPDNPPAVMRFYPPDPTTGGPPAKEKPGDFRVNLASPNDWKPLYIAVNGGGKEGEQRVEYLIDPRRATFNTTGWPMQAYLTMSGNILRGEFVGDWFRFETLRPSDLGRVGTYTIETHPHLVQRFTCVTWDGRNKVTKRIESTGTPRGQVYWYLVSNEGVCYIPARYVIGT